jgi:hypothetical protein
MKYTSLSLSKETLRRLERTLYGVIPDEDYESIKLALQTICLEEDLERNRLKWTMFRNKYGELRMLP